MNILSLNNTPDHYFSWIALPSEFFRSLGDCYG